MKTAGIAAIIAFGLVGTAFAQDDAALAKKRDDKLAEAWVKSGGWITDYNKALGESKKSGKPILAYFALTSNPAPASTNFERALGDPKFVEVGKDYVLFLHITSGVKKDRLQDLAKTKGGNNRFPYVVWLDSDGNVVSPAECWQFPEAPRAIASVDESGKRVKWFIEVKKKAAGGGNPEKIDLLFADVQMDHVKLADAEKRLANLGPPTDDQKAVLEALRVRDEVKPAIDKIREKATGYDELCEAGKKFLAIRKAGRPGPPGGPELEFFWRCLLLEARKEKDAVAFEDSLKALKAKFGDSKGSSVYFHIGTETWKSYFEEQEKSLEEMKAATKPAGK